MNKENLNKAFRELRKLGFIAKQKFSCCSSCGWSELSDLKNDNIVFYHRQDADDLFESGVCYLSWSGDGTLIKEVLENNNIKVEWNGSERTRIKIDIN